MNRAERQAVIDEYMLDTGADVVVPVAFIKWLRPKHNHVAHGHFFGKSDKEAALEYRVSLFRQFASGLRVTVRMEAAASKEVNVKVQQFPAMLSHVGGRRAGGGYQPFNPKDGAAMDELRRQGATALRGWLSRYRGAFEGVDLTTIEEIAASQDAGVALSA